jgi:hypothetical protein
MLSVPLGRCQDCAPHDGRHDVVVEVVHSPFDVAVQQVEGVPSGSSSISRCSRFAGRCSSIARRHAGVQRSGGSGGQVLIFKLAACCAPA